MYEKKKQVWYEKLWLKDVPKHSGDMSFGKLLIVTYAFKAHLMDSVKLAMTIYNTATIQVPGGCTSKVPLEVCINNPFKAILRDCWENYINVVSELGEVEKSNPSFKLSAPSREDVIDWIENGYDVLKTSQDMIKRSFEVCGISSTDPDKVRNDVFLKDIRKNIDINDDMEDDADDILTIQKLFHKVQTQTTGFIFHNDLLGVVIMFRKISLLRTN